MKKENEVNAAEKVRVLHSLHTGVEGIECTFGTSKRVEISRSPFWNIGLSTDREFHRKVQIH